MIGRNDWISLLRMLKDPLAITLVSNHELSLGAMRRCADEFFNRIERNALGARWHRKALQQRLKVVGFFEHLDSNIHLHAAVEAPGRAPSVLVNGEWTWRCVRPGGSYLCEPITGAWDWYITKDLTPINADERLYLRVGRL